ncbi:MAG: hypothetical protein JWN70_6278 [Planctomycetaceae bacterium]|nr:hypothetical protein [Planctomycetaceae bacterium]
MRRQLNAILLLVCGIFLPGCMGGFPVAVSSAKPASIPSVDPRSTELNFDDPVECQLVLGGLDHEFTRQMIAETPRGSQVLVSQFKQSYTGTLIKGTADGVELVNCICIEPVPGGPNGMQQCKTSHTPMQSFKNSEMTGFTVLSPPPPNYVVPDIGQDSSGATVVEIVYRDGIRQRYGKSPVPAKPDDRIDSAAQE